VTPLKTNYHLLPDLNLLVAISKHVGAVKFFSNKILKFLTGGASQHTLACIMAVKSLLLLLFCKTDLLT